MPKPLDLIATAKRLLENPEPSDADVRRAVSTVYYALFQAVAALSADLIVGPAEDEASRRAWGHVYRSVDHSIVKKACLSSDLQKFLPPEIAALATIFESMQSKRHRADYDPTAVFTRGPSLVDAQEAERVLAGLQHADESKLRIFVAYALFRARSA